MAIRRNNPSIGDLQGKIGDLVFYTRNGKQCVRKAPVRKKAFTAAEQKNQNRFTLAAQFARTVLSDPAGRARYAKAALGTDASAQNLAVSDFMHSPFISEIDPSEYTGKPGDVIRMKVEEGRVGAAEVTVKIVDRDGTELERGTAEMESDPDIWRYAAKKQLPPDQTVSITIEARDQPGNRSTKTVRHTTGG